jgi:hypothetical protein
MAVVINMAVILDMAVGPIGIAPPSGGDALRNENLKCDMPDCDDAMLVDVTELVKLPERMVPECRTKKIQFP